MSIKYTVVERPQPGVKGGGNKKWYANAITDGELTIDDLAKQIEKFSALYHPVLCFVYLTFYGYITPKILKKQGVNE